MADLMTVLPIATLVLAMVTISLSCGMALSLHHVPAFPQISMCGAYAPEKYFFSLGMNGVAFLLASLLLVNHMRTELMLARRGMEPMSVVYSGTQLGVGLSSALSLALMATLPVLEAPMPHVLFAIAFFSLLIIFQVLNVSARIRSSYASGWSRNMSGAKEAWMVFWMLATAAGFVGWQVTANSIPQYIATASAMLHFFPYIWEFRDTKLRVDVRVSPQEEEEARTLMDVERAPERHANVRGLPVVVALVVVGVMCGGLGYVCLRLPSVSVPTQGGSA
uniref:CWH43-like N-terminal domain-containing protein n=1 Tax=Hemiselmis andersenii TaxID=464988 RepID=A0A7S0TID8_HEMAN|mmetsp:Transcript_24608/g.57048  ORF Transcript_24608/g.57048 Transcript_24608/m.57048 type:complete len:278 (+) Transcript_24608:158-991(+)